VATIQTTVETRLTGMPRREARSPFSAEARTAMPMSVNLKKAPRATTPTDGSKGAYLDVDGGARYELGQWPGGGLAGIPVAPN
jgi:hypothetical protein